MRFVAERELARVAGGLAMEADPKWERIWKVRGEVLRELERLREQKTIGKSLEAKVTVHSDDPETQRALRSVDLTSVLVVSEAVVSDTPLVEDALKVGGLSVRAEKSPHPKCERCWGLRPDVGRETPGLCGRCAQVVRG